MQDKNFDDIYNKICSQSFNELEAERKKLKKVYITGLSIGIFLMILWFFIAKSISFILLVIPMFISVVIALGRSSKYTTVFKNKVIKEFIKQYDENLLYMPYSGIGSATYDNAEFESYDEFNSEDYIEGKILGDIFIKMSEVHTKNTTKDRNGHTKTVTVFLGLFADIQSPKLFDTVIKIRSNSGFLVNMFRSKTKLEMDSSEFEKNFDVYSGNKIVAMQILTTDVMTLLLDFKSKYNISFEITLKNNHIYIRFNTGEMFEPTYMKSSLDKKILKRYFDIINFTLDLSCILNKIVKDTEI